LIPPNFPRILGIVPSFRSPYRAASARGPDSRAKQRSDEPPEGVKQEKKHDKKGEAAEDTPVPFSRCAPPATHQPPNILRHQLRGASISAPSVAS
jgi:hypothetical protein